jgi:hypothetical protein
MEKSSNVSHGVGFMRLLCLIFITLKLLKLITWSWWLVLLPLYGPLIILMVYFFLVWFLND